jgi:fructokinase
MDNPTILVAGETLIDFLPAQSGPLSGVETFSRQAGGAAANVAVALARLDARPWFLTNLSTDGFGDFLAATLEDNQVPDRFVTRSDHPTTLAFVAHDESADRSFTFYGTDAADHYLDAGAVSNAVLDSLDWVCVDAPVALAAEPARSALGDLCERAHEHGCHVAFDPNTRRELWPDEDTFRETLNDMLSRADVVKTSVEDLAATPFAADAPADLAENLFAVGPHTVFLTQGAEGACAFATERAPWGPADSNHPGYEVNPIDATGAGDAFLAGVLCALADGTPLNETLASANAVAALTTTETSAIDALPDYETVVNFCEAHSG